MLETCNAHNDCAVVYEWYGAGTQCPVCRMQDAIEELESTNLVLEDDVQEYRNEVKDLESRLEMMQEQMDMLESDLMTERDSHG